LQMSGDNDASEIETKVEVEAPRQSESSGRGGRRFSQSGRKSGDNKGGFKRRHGEAHHHNKGKKRFRDDFIYPTGGNIHDPLNLNSVTPGTVDPPLKRPKDFPLKVKIPGTLHDPLNLLGEIPMDESLDNPLVIDDPIVSPMPIMSFSKNKKKFDYKPKKKVEVKNEDKEEEQPKNLTKEEKEALARKEKKEAFNKKYSYGNFDRYYGHRLTNGQRDPRLSVLNREWFEKRTVLDIGCNAGFLTLSIAKEYGPRRILGIDIDEHLIGVARKNIRHYCDKNTELAGKFPASFARQFGPISQTSLSFSTKFPDNIWFRTENFVLENDDLLETVEEEYDVILALSITKWIHLNWGDDGMRRFFKRCFASLHPGGRLILEPQHFSTYRKRSVMSEELKTNYRSIEFKPEDFEMYLLEECGFESVEHLTVTGAKAKGFDRPIDVYVKKPPAFMRKRETKKVERKKDEHGEKEKKEEGEMVTKENEVKNEEDAMDTEAKEKDCKIDESRVNPQESKSE
ncbi:hypothetical protein PMAYCL1PPCAC_06582, partial [Pristionchus mayeri]